MVVLLQTCSVVVQLVRPVKVNSQHVESWLSSLLVELQYSVQTCVSSAAGELDDPQLRTTGDFLQHIDLPQVTTGGI